MEGRQINCYSPKIAIWDRWVENLEEHLCLSVGYGGSFDSLLRANT